MCQLIYAVLSPYTGCFNCYQSCRCLLHCHLLLFTIMALIVCMAVSMQGTMYKAALHMDLVIAEEGAPPVCC